MNGDEELQRYLSGVSFRMKRKLAEVIKQEADTLAEAIRAAAPRDTGTLANSVNVRRRKGELELEVIAGGDATTKGDRGPDGVADYALFVEYGTQDAAAQPFFYSTYRERAAGIRQRIEAAIAEVLS